MVVFVVGHIWRWRYDQFGWTSRSTQLQERRLLKWGAPLFHYATFAAIGGHILGILVPKAATEAIGIPENVYTTFSGVAGSIAAFGVLIGAGILVFRRTLVPRVRATTSAVDYLALILLGIIVHARHLPHARRAGVRQRLRLPRHASRSGSAACSPAARTSTAIADAPIMYQVHATAAWAIFAVWPFSRLVHAWSYPLWYLWRPYIVIRSRVAGRPAEPGTGGRKWRKIGVPY